MAEPFDTLGVAIADVIQRLADGEITEAQAGEELSPLLAGVNDGEFGARVEDIIGVMGRITGLLMVEAPPSNLLGAPGSYAWDRVGKVFYGPKDAVTGWPPGDAMTEGPPGPAVQLQTTATHIQWRVVGTSTWTNLIALSSLKGADGKEVSLQKSATHVQWRLGTGAWTDLIPLADLKGATGEKGDQGDIGPKGDTGDVGPKGDTGDQGPQGEVGPKGDTGDLGPKGDTGDIGPVGPKGDTGDAAWSPIYANVADGTRRVQRVVDWTGGQGAKPATGKYLGPAGLVDTAAEATDIRGASGAGTGDMLGSNNLNDVTDKAIARQNLSVWSRAEVGAVDANYLSLIDSADPAGLSFAPTGVNFAKDTGRLDYVDAASSAAVPGLTYSRTGAATAWRQDGTLAEFAPNVMRRTDAGVTIEGQRTNLLLNSATLSTQSVAVTAAPHTISFNGTGTITLSGASTAGPLVGPGANKRVSLTFTPTAGTLTVTVSGSVTYGQLEQASTPSTPIITTGAAATRGADNLSLAKTVAAEEDFAILVTAKTLRSGGEEVIYDWNDGSAANRIYVYFRGANGAVRLTSRRNNVNQRLYDTVQTYSTGDLVTIALSRRGGAYTMAVGGVIAGTATPTSPQLALTSIRFGVDTPGGAVLGSTISRAAIFPYALTDAELVEMTR